MFTNKNIGGWSSSDGRWSRWKTTPVSENHSLTALHATVRITFCYSFGVVTRGAWYKRSRFCINFFLLLIRNQWPEKPQDTEFHASQIEFFHINPPYWIRHIGFWKFFEYYFIFPLLAWFLRTLMKNEYYEKFTRKKMHILKILSCLTILGFGSGVYK